MDPKRFTLHGFELIDKKRLPFKLQELIAVIGLEQSYLLSYNLGGQIIYVPKKRENTTFSKIISCDALHKLGFYYGGQYLNVPSVIHFDKQLRNIMIFEMIKSGVSRSLIAKKFNIGIRQVANIKKEYLHSLAS